MGTPADQFSPIESGGGGLGDVGSGSGLWSTCTDLGRLGQLLLGKGTICGKQVVRKEVMTVMAAITSAQYQSSHNDTRAGIPAEMSILGASGVALVLIPALG